MKIISPYKIKKVLFTRRYPGYIYRRELIDDSGYGGNGELEMLCCYAPDTGHWIGDSKTARYLCNTLGLKRIQKSKPDHCVASIGFNEKEKKWYGWSHRCICGFGKGDKVFIERFGDDNTPFKKHGRTTISNMRQAKTAAKRFAAYVS